MRDSSHQPPARPIGDVPKPGEEPEQDPKPGGEPVPDPNETGEPEPELDPASGG